MKLTQEPRVSLGVNLVQVTVVGSFVAGALIAGFFFFGGMFQSSDSLAATETLNSGSTVQAKSNPFSSASDGDSIVIKGQFNVNADYTLHANNAITLVVDGSNAEVKVFKDKKLVLGSGSSIVLLNGGSITSTGGCTSTAKIYFGSTEVANCAGSSSISSFDAVNSGGGIGSNGIVLPVTWLDVSARNLGNGDVQLKWSTAGELNNSYFTIEFSEDGENFIEGPIVRSKAPEGTTNEILNYSEVHYAPRYMSQIFYRIKQTDFNGKFDYSSIVSVKSNDQDEIVVSTLGNSQIRVDYKSQFNEASDVNIYNEGGANVYSQPINEQQIISLPQPGLYIVEVVTRSGIDRVKHWVL